MASLNKIMVIGNVGKDVEMRFTPSGKPVSSFSVACTSKYGETETTQWFSIVTWGKLAESCNQYLEKGRQVYVEGRLQVKEWDDNEGNKRFNVEITANTVLFLGKRQDGENVDEVEDIPL